MIYFYWTRVVAKQHLKNFVKHEILTKLFWISRNFDENKIVDFREIFVKILKYFLRSELIPKVENSMISITSILFLLIQLSHVSKIL